MSWQEARAIADLSGVPSSIIFDSENNIFCATSTGWIIEYSNEGEVLLKKPIHSKGINQITISYDNKFVVTCSDDTTCALMTASTLTKNFTYTGSLGKLIACDISPFSDLICAAGEDMMIHVWFADQTEHATFISAHSDIITSIKFSQDGENVITASLDGLCKIWALYDNQIVLLRTFFSVQMPIMDAVLLPSEKFILTNYADGVLRLYELKSNDIVAQYEMSSGGMTRSMIKYRADGDNIEIVATSCDGVLHTWDFCKRKLISAVPAGKCLCAFDISRDGNILAVCDSGDNCLKVFHRSKQ